MERERFNFDLNSKYELRRKELIDGVTVEFDENYQDVYTGVKNKAVLYAGDYIYGKPKELIIEVRPELLTVDYAFLFGLFEQKFKDDVVGDSFTQRIRKYPEAGTLFLTEFIKTNREKDYGKLGVLQTNYNLKPALDGSDIVMTIDQYLMPDALSDIPASEVWTMRRYNNGWPLKTNLLNPGVSIKRVE